MAKTPSVGRVVHYVAYGSPGGEYPAGICRAAIVAQVTDPGSAHGAMLDLVVLNPSGIFFGLCPEDQENHAPGSWHWPEYVPDS
jgi:hypothetical protein